VREQTGIDRDERSGERAFAKDVLQKVWDAQRDVEGVAHIGRAEVVRHHALTHEADDAREQYAGHDEERMLARARLALARHLHLLGRELARDRSDGDVRLTRDQTYVLMRCVWFCIVVVGFCSLTFGCWLVGRLRFVLQLSTHPLI